MHALPNSKKYENMLIIIESSYLCWYKINISEKKFFTKAFLVLEIDR